MKVISASVNMLANRVLTIGFVGENERTQIRIDAGNIFAEYPHSSPSLAIKPPSGPVYPIVVNQEGDEVVWDVLRSDLNFSGDGEIQLTFIKDNVVAKTVIGKIKVNRSLLVTGETPDPIVTWAEQATAKLAEVDEAIYALEQIDATAEGLAAGTNPTVQVVDYDDHKRFEFGIPKGDKGDKGDTYELTQADREEIAQIAEENFSDRVTQMYDEVVEDTEIVRQAVTAAGNSASRAAESEVNAELARRDAASFALSAEDSKSQAEQFKIAAGQSASQAEGSAQQAHADALISSQKADESAESAESAHADRLATEAARIASESARDAAVIARNEAVAAKDIAVSAKDTAVDAKDTAVASKETAVGAKDAVLAAKTQVDIAKADVLTAQSQVDQKASEASQSAQSAAQSAEDAAESAETAQEAVERIQIATVAETVEFLGIAG